MGLGIKLAFLHQKLRVFTDYRFLLSCYPETMGVFYNFVCPNCGYKAQVNGGVDSLEYLTFKTMVCTDCFQLVDALVEIRPQWSRRQKNGKGGYKTKSKCVVFCPNCNGINLIPWGKPYPCPKCNREMTSDKGLRFLE